MADSLVAADLVGRCGREAHAVGQDPEVGVAYAAVGQTDENLARPGTRSWDGGEGGRDCARGGVDECPVGLREVRCLIHV